MLGFKRAIGLEIGEQKIRIAQLSQTPFYLQVTQYSQIEVSCFASKTQALQELLHQTKLKPARAVVSLPRNQLLLKVIQMPALKERELKQALRYAVEEHIPYPLNEVICDYQILGIEEGQAKVLLGAVRLEVIQPYLEILASVGIEAKIIEVDSLALINLCLSRLNKVKQGAVLIVNPQLKEVSLLKDGQFQFSRLTTNAEIKQMVEDLAPAKLLALNRADDWQISLSEELVELSTLCLLVKKGLEPASLTPISLAYRAFHSPLCLNLSPLKAFYEERERRRAIGQTFSLLIVNLLLIGAITGLEIIKKEQQIARIRAKMSRIQPEVEKTLAQKRELDQLKKQINTINQAEKIEALGVLNELSKILPPDTWIKSLTLERGKFRLQVRSLKSTSRLLSIIEGSPYLEEVEFKGNIIRVKQQTGIEIEEATLVGKLT